MKQTIKTGETMIIRPAAKTDAPSLLVFLKKVTAETDFLLLEASDITMSLSAEEDFIDSFTNMDNRLLLIGEISGLVVGVSHLEGFDAPRIRHSGELGVSVLKEYWGRGIGTLLMYEVIKWAKETGFIRKINLRVHEENKRAIELYRRHGFVREGVKTREFLIDNKFYNALMMGLWID